MKRTELERRTPLVDGSALARPSRRAAALDAEKPARKPAVRIPATMRIRVYNRSAGICIVCLYREGVNPADLTIGALRQLVRHGVIREARQLHHVFPKSDERWPHLAKVEANLVGCCAQCHADHEHSARGWIPVAALPECALALAEAEGAMDYLRRRYAA